MRRGEIAIGQIMNVVVLDKPFGKRTGEIWRVRILALTYLWGHKDAIRQVHVETMDLQPVRRQWIDPKYLVSIPAEG